LTACWYCGRIEREREKNDKENYYVKKKVQDVQAVL